MEERGLIKSLPAYHVLEVRNRIRVCAVLLWFTADPHLVFLPFEEWLYIKY